MVQATEKVASSRSNQGGGQLEQVDDPKPSGFGEFRPDFRSGPRVVAVMLWKIRHRPPRQVRFPGVG